MATPNHPTDELNHPLDPAQLGADAQPETSPQDDSHDMSTVMADTDTDGGRPFAHQPANAQQGSDFAEQRHQGAAGAADQAPTDTGHGLGMGRAGFDGDEDRGYDQSGYRGGLGSSGGREDLDERPPNPDANPFTGSGQDQPPAAQTQHLGLNTPSPTSE